MLRVMDITTNNLQSQITFGLALYLTSEKNTSPPTTKRISFPETFSQPPKPVTNNHVFFWKSR